MRLIKDMGMQFPTKTSKQKSRYGLYECPSCLDNIRVRTIDVKRGVTTICIKCTNTTHGLSKHKLYQTWCDMRHRCNSPKYKRFKDYGDRGIKVSDEFKDFAVWLKYVESLDNCYKDKYSIDRIDNDLGYERKNLRWTSKAIQSRNTRLLSENNTSGYRGVCYNKSRGKWKAYITVNSKNIGLGHFADKLEAAKARDKYVIDNNLEHTLNFRKDS